MSRRARSRRPMVDAQAVFERTVVDMCREAGLHRRLSPVDIDVVVRVLVAEFAGTLEEFSTYLENEDWDALATLAAREQTMRVLRPLRTGGVRGARRV